MLHVVLLVHLCTHGILHRLLTYAQNDVEIDIITEKTLSYTTHKEAFGIAVAHGTLPLIKVYNALILVDVLEECRRDIRHALYLMLENSMKISITLWLGILLYSNMWRSLSSSCKRTHSSRSSSLFE